MHCLLLVSEDSYSVLIDIKLNFLKNNIKKGMLQKAKVDFKPLLSSLSTNEEKLKKSSHSGILLSVEEVEAGLKGLKVEQNMKNSTPFMAEHLGDSECCD